MWKAHLSLIERRMLEEYGNTGENANPIVYANAGAYANTEVYANAIY